MSNVFEQLLPTVAAGVFALGGTSLGLVLGRRQTIDQAAVEHDQWLRGQRQQAYSALLDAWDQAIAKLEHTVDMWPDRSQYVDDQGGEWEELQRIVEEDVVAAWQILAKPLDQASLLGPESVDDAVLAMHDVFDGTAAYLNHQADPGEPFDHEWESWQLLLSRIHTARLGFTQAAKETLRQPPRPGRRLTAGRRRPASRVPISAAGHAASGRRPTG